MLFLITTVWSTSSKFALKLYIYTNHCFEHRAFFNTKKTPINLRHKVLPHRGSLNKKCNSDTWPGILASCIEAFTRISGLTLSTLQRAPLKLSAALRNLMTLDKRSLFHDIMFVHLYFRNITNPTHKIKSWLSF